MAVEPAAAPPVEETPPVEEAPPVDTAPVVETAPTPQLPEGFVRLSDAAKRAKNDDPYVDLRPFIGATIAIRSVSEKEGAYWAEIQRFDGTALVGDTVSLMLPKASVKRIVRAANSMPGSTILATVEQTKRGLALH